MSVIVQHPLFPFPLCRLGLASRGGSGLRPEDVRHALDRGVNFLNWCGQPDGLSAAVAGFGRRRHEVAVCVQFEARTALEARQELPTLLQQLGTDYIDVLTFYYVEHDDEWKQIIAPGGALEYCQEAKAAGTVRVLGVTSHQRRLAAKMAASGLLDLLMIRYNAAHRGAEQEIFPVTQARHMPVVAYTCLRWGALMQRTPDDPADFQPPAATQWYRFALHHPAVTVALMAPENRQELDEDLTVLEQPPLTDAEFATLAGHGQRVRRHAGSFP